MVLSLVSTLFMSCSSTFYCSLLCRIFYYTQSGSKHGPLNLLFLVHLRIHIFMGFRAINVINSKNI